MNYEIGFLDFQEEKIRRFMFLFLPREENDGEFNGLLTFS